MEANQQLKRAIDPDGRRAKMDVPAVRNRSTTMDPYVVQQNIRRFQDMLEQARDPVEREKLSRMIDREQAQLEEALKKKADKLKRP
ncbi:hypothetical protein [Rhizobium aegyptiacum]|uniref:hypothetical protein n=1 Tax=Rhizobium aegyptiacum TaxID=1764550 RepID=UPI0007E576E7|nr:hypothetical protein [Rhizobium aegyptiacum]